MSWTSGGRTQRRQAMPPDRLAAVLDEVDQARRTGGWTPQEPADRGRRTSSRDGAAASTGRRRAAADPAPEDEAEARPRHLRTGPDRAVRPHTTLVRPPRSLQDAVVAPGRLAAACVLVLVLAVGAVLGGRLLWLRSTTEQPPPQPVAGAPSETGERGPQGTPGADPAAKGAAPAPSSAAPSSLLVHVVGQVEQPGVVTVRTGARVRDALEAAGGALTGADLTRLNLARPVTDGEQVVVPKPGEEITPAPAPPPGATPEGGSAPTAGGESPPATVNLNQADQSALEQLPGVGPVLAGRIVQWRTDNGPFTVVDELSEVSGIGEKMLAQLRPHVTV